jgi:hypothetical protein
MVSQASRVQGIGQTTPRGRRRWAWPCPIFLQCRACGSIPSAHSADPTRIQAENTNGLPLFKAALTNGTTAASLYALCGIRHLAPEEFGSLAAPFTRTNSLVGVTVGSIKMGLPTSNIVARIKDGWYEEFCPAHQKGR